MLKWEIKHKHLQLILLAYKLVGALVKPTMLKYLQKDLRPSIVAELQNENHKLKSFVQIVKKTVVAKAKANLQSGAITKNMNQHYF